jgi:hypothetical protein
MPAFSLGHTEYVAQTEGENPIVTFNAMLRAVEAVHGVTIAFSLDGISLPALEYEVAALAPQEQAPGFAISAAVDFETLRASLGQGTNPINGTLALAYSTEGEDDLTETFDLAGDIWFMNFAGLPDRVRIEAGLYPLT